jgi:hypothetical protein
MPELTWTAILLFVLPCIAGMTGMKHCVQPCEMGSRELLLPGLASNLNLPGLSLPSS